MSLTQDEQDLLRTRAQLLTPAEERCIEAAFASLYYTARKAGVQAATDDRAKKLEACFIRYMLDSR
jgi:hypothetical protein